MDYTKTTDPTAHAIRHLDEAEDRYKELEDPFPTVDALLGIGWALVGISNELAALRGQREDRR